MAFPVRSILARGLLALLAGGACAHAGTVWLQPDLASPSPGEPVTIRIVTGESPGHAERAVEPTRADVLERIWKYGRSGLLPDAAGAPSVAFRPERPGANLVVYGCETDGAYAKTIVIVGSARRGDPLRWSEVGQRLEIVPQSDPVVLEESGGTLEVQVLFEREPLADARVKAAPVGGAPGRDTGGVTDEIGLTRLRLGEPGWWVIGVEHRTVAEDGNGPGLLRATLTIHAGGPSR